MNGSFCPLTLNILFHGQQNDNTAFILYAFDLLFSQVFQTSHLLENQPTLHPEKWPDVPLTTASATAIVIGRILYLCGGYLPDVPLAHIVQVYDLDKAKWTSLPLRTPVFNYEAAAVNNQLVVMGGYDSLSWRVTNIVSTWTGQAWVQDLPAMPTKRSRPGVMTYGTYVVVAGGLAMDRRTLLRSIDILNTTTRQWWTPANLQLPQPMYQMTLTVCTTHIYVAGAAIGVHLGSDIGTTADVGVPSTNAWQLPVSTFAQVLMNKDYPLPQQWTEIAPTPHYRSTLLKHTTHPLVVGGHNYGGIPTANIAVYNPDMNKWLSVGRLLKPRARSAVVGLTSCSFLVLGGFTNGGDTVNSRVSSVEHVRM